MYTFLSLFFRNIGLATTCDVLSNYGCNSWDLNSDGSVNRHACNMPEEEKGLMYWVAAPERSHRYSVRTGDGCQFCSSGGDVTKYVPNEILTIYIRAYDYRHKYRGLMIHANDDDGNVVGEWVVPPDSTPQVHAPCSNPGVLLQTSAELKPSLLRLSWRAPPAGTGKVTFLALIKEGPANKGEFWYPNYYGDLILKETSDSEPNVWIPGLEQESCTDACERAGEKCSQGMLDLVDSTEDFLYLIGNQITCNLPILSDCFEASPLFQSNAQCTYFDSDCAEWRSQDAQSSCSAVPTGGDIRLCPCTADGKVPPAFLGAGPSSRGSMSWSVVLLLCVCWLAVFPSLGVGHNWMGTPCRNSGIASTLRPCSVRRQTDVHAQVGPGQEFVHGHMSGHPGRTNTMVLLNGKFYISISLYLSTLV